MTQKRRRYDLDEGTLIFEHATQKIINIIEFIEGKAPEETATPVTLEDLLTQSDPEVETAAVEAQASEWQNGWAPAYLDYQDAVVYRYMRFLCKDGNPVHISVMQNVPTLKPLKTSTGGGARIQALRKHRLVYRDVNSGQGMYRICDPHEWKALDPDADELLKRWKKQADDERRKRMTQSV